MQLYDIRNALGGKRVMGKPGCRTAHQLSNLGVDMGKAVLRFTTVGLLAAAGFMGIGGAAITDVAIPHHGDAVSASGFADLTTAGAVPADDQWG
ncbi:hypothetical protein ACRAWF_31795 [Streptomyces sp. L7]